MLQLNKDDCVDVNGIVDGWYRIAIDDTAGYICADYLTFDQTMTDTQEVHHERPSRRRRQMQRQTAY